MLNKPSITTAIHRATRILDISSDDSSYMAMLTVRKHIEYECKKLNHQLPDIPFYTPSKMTALIGLTSFYLNKIPLK
jgi:hypothetical protein